MNIAESFIARHGKALGLDRLGTADQWVSVQVTPRFQTSAHVVFLLLDPRSAEPRLVLKAARFDAGNASLVREAEVLRSVHASRPGGFDSIPRLLASTVFNGTRILLETGLPGQPMNERMVRRDFAACRDAIASWVRAVHTATLLPPDRGHGSAFYAHAERPLAVLDRWLPEDRPLIDRTRVLLEPLRERPIPRVFEHGDLSAPNLLMQQGRLQVVDWELASPEGVPACDLFFGFHYLAAARQGWGPRDVTRGFREAFFGPEAWATPIVREYGSDLGLDVRVVRALFVLCWVRYLARLAERLPAVVDGPVPAEQRSWLRGNRYFETWATAVENSDSLFEETMVTGAPA